MGGCVSENSALEGGGFGDEASDVESDAFGVGGSAASATNGTTSEDDGGGKSGNLGLPPGFFVARELGQLSEVIAKLGVPSFELWEEFVADAVAGKGEMAVGGVFAPGLVTRLQKGFDFGPAGLEKRAEDGPFGEVQDRMDTGKALRPGTPEELGEDCFCLVVESVGGGDGVEGNFAKELTKPCVAEAASSAFDGVGSGIICGDFGRRPGRPACLRGGVDAGFVKGDDEC